jgi:hypothetical protein
MLIFKIDSYHTEYVGIVFKDTIKTVIDLKSIISEYQYKYLDIFGKMASSQVLLRQF